MKTKTVQSLASEAIKFFATKTRADGTEYVSTTDDRPDWVQEMCVNAHDRGKMLPDDQRYNMIKLALLTIADADDVQDTIYSVEAPTYTSELTEWLDSANSRVYYLTKVLQDNDGYMFDGYYLLEQAWLAEFRDVAESIISSLESQAENETE